MSADDLRLITRNDALIAQPIGEIDLANADQLANRIAEAAPGNRLGVVIDLSEVGFLDSFGIYVIVGLSQRLTQQGQSLAIVVPKDSPVLGTLRVSKVDTQLPILNGIDEAVSMLTVARSDT